MCVQCAQKVLEILDQMEAGGQFRGLTEEQKEIERQMLGMRLRQDMDCPDKIKRAPRPSVPISYDNLTPEEREIVDNLETNKEFKKSIRRGLDDMKAGRFIHFDSVEELLAEVRRRAAELEPPADAVEKP